jgi:MOSC domain-containing protein YiiM
MTRHLETASGAPTNLDRADAHLTTMHRTPEQLEAGIAAIRESPRDQGTLDWIACRPAVGERTVLDTAALDVDGGLVGDSWTARPSSKMPDRRPHPDAQVTLMNARVIALIAGDRDRWAIAGDQLYVDLDLSLDNLPAGTRLQIGDAVLEVTALPHTGCAKFSARFGSEALRWVNTPTGRALNLRGIYVRVVTAGQVRRGDSIRKLA